MKNLKMKFGKYFKFKNTINGIDYFLRIIFVSIVFFSLLGLGILLLEINLAIAIIFMITTAFSGKKEGAGMVQATISIGAFIAVLYFFGMARGWFGELPRWLEDPMYQGVIITVTIIGTLVGYADSGEDKD